jgi:ribosome-binding ATPase
MFTLVKTKSTGTIHSSFFSQIMFKIGIVGLPNVGKSTLFNALTKSKGAQMANYPFCTIEPNTGIVEVPDDRLSQLAKTVNPEKVIPAVVEFVDIAGLVKGASEGEGLGNKFLANIRECNAILQVVREFEDADIQHVHEKIDPKSDIEVINTELILADMETCKKRLDDTIRQAKAGDKVATAKKAVLEKMSEGFNNGQLAIDMNLGKEDQQHVQDCHFLTNKPFLYAANMSENDVGTADVTKLHADFGLSQSAQIIPVSARVEQELNELSEEDKAEFLESLGLTESTLNQLIKAAYTVLGYQTYFTAGVKEVRAWTIVKGATAPQAAGVIHSDFEKGFIRAETVLWKDFVEFKGEAGAKEKGKLRSEGKEYIVRDGDVMHFLFS